jgi:hypothetical protein
MVSLEDLARIAEIEFSDIVDSTEMMETKLRIMLTEGGFVEEGGEISSEYLLEASSALSALRTELRWKPGKDIQHLEKRKAMGHLPKHSSLEDYNALINELIEDNSNVVYLYEFRTKRYYAVRGSIQGVDWVVIFGKDGIIETTFPPKEIDGYIQRRGFRLLGKIEEVLRWKKGEDC